MRHLTRRQLLVLIGASLFQCALLGTLVNSSGVLLAQIRAELGFSMTRISTFMTIKSIAGALCGAFCAAVFFRRNKAVFMMTVVVSNVLAFLLLAVGADSWLWYLSAVIQGVAFSTATIMVPFVLDQWFPEGAGMAAGIAMAFSGLGGVVCNPMASWLITVFGWKWAIAVLGAATLLLAVPGVALMFQVSPPAAADGEAPSGGRAEAAHSRFDAARFLLCTLLFLGGSIAMQFVQYISMYAQSVGYTLAIGASLTSVLMVGNIAGKFIFGGLCDRMGIWKAMVCALGAVALSSLCLIVGCLPALYVATLLFGIVYAIAMISVSRASLAAYGAGATRYMGLHASVNSAVGAVFSMGVGLLYDSTQSFTPLLVLVIALCTVSALASVALARKSVR